MHADRTVANGNLVYMRSGIGDFIDASQYASFGGERTHAQNNSNCNGNKIHYRCTRPSRVQLLPTAGDGRKVRQSVGYSRTNGQTYNCGRSPDPAYARSAAHTSHVVTFGDAEQLSVHEILFWQTL